ncbi:MAG: Na+:solute symporter [Planctomycetales bacterium]|nr:Na+:solute symporter [Planctomycetales bacterium]
MSIKHESVNFMELNALDWAIIIGYFAVTIAIGLIFSRRAGSSLSEYFVSGRSLPWWIAGTSMVATTFAADTPLAVTGLVAKDGLAGNWVWWSFAAGGMVTVFVYAKLWRRAEVMTDVEFLELRYQGPPAAALRGIRAVYLSLIINPIIIGWVTGAMLTVLKETVLHGTADTWVIAGQSISKDWMIIIACLSVVGIYCTFSGMWGVAVTDFIQFFTAMTGCVLLAYFAVKSVGGLDTLHDKVAQNFGDGQQAFGFLPDFSADKPWMPVEIFLIFLFVQWWATWYPGAEPGGGGYVVQRMASCKDERHTILATLWYQLAHYCLRPWPWILVAFVALAQYPELRQLATDPDFAKAAGTNADAGFARVIRDFSPHGLRGLMLVTFFSAFMSTISTQMNWGASYLVRDVFQRFIAPQATDRQLTTASRIMSVLVLVVGGIVSKRMVGMDIGDIWKMLLALGAGTGAVFMLRWFWWRINAWTEIVAMLGSLGFFWLFKYQLKLEARDEIIGVYVAVATIVTWLVVTFVTPPERPEILSSFYRKVRPAGPGWKHIAALNPDVTPDRHLGLSFLTALFAAGIVYCTIPGIGFLLFSEFGKAAGCAAGAIVCGGVVMSLIRKVGWENTL